VAIATIAYDAMMGCYGVVGSASKDLAAGIATKLAHDRKPGVAVHVEGGQVTIDLYVIIEYGTRIAAVARSVMDVVQFRVEQALGIDVTAVNVHVEALRVSNVD
jgi:uncharacterized alkaline shock family protein YloU